MLRRLLLPFIEIVIIESCKRDRDVAELFLEFHVHAETAGSSLPYWIYAT